MTRLSLLALAFSLTSTAAIAEGDSWIAYGKQLVEANCAACHSINLTDDSTHPEAPPFRTLGERYPIDALEESFVEGIFTGHPDMPQFVATPRQINAIIDFIGSLTIKN